MSWKELWNYNDFMKMKKRMRKKYLFVTGFSLFQNIEMLMIWSEEFHLCKTHSTTFHMFGVISVKLGELYGREQISTICRLWRNMNSLQMGQYAILVSNSRLQHAWNISESTFSPKTQLWWVWKWSSGVLNYSTIDPWRIIVVEKFHLRWI